MFAVRDSNQSSLGFSPFELVFGHTPKGPLKLVKDQWLKPHNAKDLLDYVAHIKARLVQATRLAKKHLSQSQAKTKAWFDKKAKARVFEEGDQVLLYLPTHKSSLQAKYYGPYTVRQRTSDTGYVIDTPDRRRQQRFVHVNRLKAFHVRENARSAAVVQVNDNEPDDVIPTRKLDSDVLNDMDEKLHHLPADHSSDISNSIDVFTGLFPDAPWTTNVMTLDINIGDDTPVKSHLNGLNPAEREILTTEIKLMPNQGVIVSSNSPWTSRGYCNIPSIEKAMIILTLATPDGFYHYQVRLKQVINRMQEANLTVNLDTCEFGKAKVTFPGQIVYKGSVSPLQTFIHRMMCTDQRMLRCALSLHKCNFEHFSCQQ
jgi:hypothetical protein